MDADIYRDNYELVLDWLLTVSMCLLNDLKFILNTIFYDSFTHLAGISTEVGGQLCGPAVN